MDKTFVMLNIPCNFNADLVKDYVEVTLDKDVEKVITFPFIQNRALILMKETLSDFTSAAKKLKKEKIESQEIVLSRTYKKLAIFVTDIDFRKLEKEFLIHYLQCTFADNEEIVRKCECWPSLKVAAVHFLSKHQEVVDKIVATEDHIPLPSENYHIKIQPFFANFHDHINQVPIAAVSPSHSFETKPNTTNVLKKHKLKANNNDLSEVESTQATEGSNTRSEYQSKQDHKKCNKNYLDFDDSDEDSDKDIDDGSIRTSTIIRQPNNPYSKQHKSLLSSDLRSEQQIEMSLPHFKCLQSFIKSVDNCEFYYNSDKKATIIKGPFDAVQKCQVDLTQKLRDIKVDTIDVCNEVRNILSTEMGKHFLSNLTSSEFHNAFLELDSHGVKITAVDNIAFNEAAKAVREKLNHTETIKGKSHIPDDDIERIIWIEKKYLIKIKWDAQNAEFVIHGIEDDVMSARKEIENFLQQFGIFEKSFDVGKPLAKYFSSCLEEHIKAILRPVKITSQKINENKIAIRFHGSREETNQASEELEKLKAEINCSPMNLTNIFKKLEIFLICKSFQSGILKDVVKDYKFQHKCLIDISNLSSFNLTSKATKKSKLPKSSKKLSTGVLQTLTAQQENSSKKLFAVTNTCQLVIKPYGDIVSEKSHILVSVLGTDLDLRKTRTGISFNNNYQSHWKEVKRSYEQSFNKSIVTVKGPKGISCLAVCHVVLEPWDPINSDAKLMSAIHEVFKQARLLGAKTVSFPALGCGKMFKFPPSNFAQSMINAIKSLNIGNFLQKVVILAPDQSIFNELELQGSSHFKSLNLPLKAKKCASPEAHLAQTSMDTSEESSDDDVLTVENSNADKRQSTTEIIIMTHHSKNIQELIKQIKREITEKCLHTEYFNQDILKYWPGQSRKKIIEKAKTLFVLVERSPHPKTKYVGFFLKGEKEAVNLLIKFIQEELQELSSHLPKKIISSSKFRRGTVDFMRYASESDELFPSYWSLNGSKSFFKSLKSLFSKKQKDRNLLVNVDKETKDAVTNLVMKTFEPHLVGQGHDAVGLTHRAVKVVDVQRVENIELFEVYRDQRKRLFKRMVNMKHICPDIGKLPGSNGRVVTSKYLSDAMKKELYYEVNEHYLFHGAKADTIDAIIHKGIDPKLASDEAMLGRGVYAAEKSTKSDQYTDSTDRRLRNGSNLKLILARVLLGNVYLCDRSSKFVTGKGAKKLSRPPCTKCLNDHCKCTALQFDSVMGDGGWLYREFIVYDASHCYPEYVITYQRS
ncbi:hypothetical protein Btru_024551 [Bulinus truncatus]|nr:hypothetical protein Btru_024551 [Bulinus truncatus]